MQNQDVYFIDGVRTPFGKAGEKGVYWKTRADDLVVKAMIGLLERHQTYPKRLSMTSPLRRRLNTVTRACRSEGPRASLPDCR